MTNLGGDLFHNAVDVSGKKGGSVPALRIL